ncbi:MAG: CHAT domain-containing protein, partial [Cyanobacteria bacterium J06592_8]
GNASIDNIAGNDINTDNQTATNEGDASINNVADNNINTENQTATSDNGNASIDNVADNNINTDNQTATSDNGNASINNVADNNINTENQTATTNERDASINNTAGNDINTENQTATTNEGNALIRNEAGNDINVGDQTAMGTDSATIENIAGGTITTESQIALEDGNPGTIINQEGDANPSPPEIVESESIVNPVASQTPQVTPQNSEQPLTNQRPNNDNNTNNSSNLNNSEVVQDITLDPDGNYDASNPSSDVANALNLNSVSPLSIASADTVTTLELSRNQEFTRYFGEEFAEENLTTENVRNILNNITQQTGTHSAVVYITLQTNQLELVIFTAEGQPLFHRVEVTREEFVNVARQFYIHVANPRLSNQYIKPAQQLYDWLIRPLEPQLQQAGIDTILLSLDSGLRGLPIAALHDGEQFLIEKYSLSLIPSISLIDTNYRTLANTEVLAMGASEFTKLDPLPAVPLELELITQRRWQGESFLNQEFTRDNLINQRQKHPYSIIHLATHSDFSRKTPDESYIQLWQDEQLKLNQLRTLGWQNPPLELLILSSCRTAVGDEQAEMGFAGLAVQAGVKSALASLWYVNDVGTLALMSEFYRHLDQTAIKADALRKAQLAMIQGSVEDLETLLYASQSLDEITLTTPISSLSSLDLSHPYYWSGFTMIGSPW